MGMGWNVINNIRLKAKMLFNLSRTVNSSFGTILNRFILILFIFSCLLLIFRCYTLNMVIIICIISLGCSLNFRRVSENFNLNMITGCLNMNLNNPNEYWDYSYLSEREKISKELKQGFIDGIINASEHRKSLKMHTHKWMIEEVVHSEEIQSRFDIKIIKNKKPMKISTEILILISKEEFEENLENIYKIVERERDSFNVMFKKK